MRTPGDGVGVKGGAKGSGVSSMGTVPGVNDGVTRSAGVEIEVVLVVEDADTCCKS